MDQNLNLRPKTLRPLGVIIGEKLQDPGFDSEFLDMTPKVQAR